MRKGRSRGDKAAPPPRREPGRAVAASAAERRATLLGGGGRKEPEDARAVGAPCREALERAASFETSLGTAVEHGFLSTSPLSRGTLLRAKSQTGPTEILFDASNLTTLNIFLWKVHIFQKKIGTLRCY